jgi:hypothetical protein
MRSTGWNFSQNMSKKVRGIVVVSVDDGGTTLNCSWILILLLKAM